MKSEAMDDDFGTQAITRDLGPEVHGRGLHHQSHDKNALLERTEAQFQRNFLAT